MLCVCVCVCLPDTEVRPAFIQSKPRITLVRHVCRQPQREVVKVDKAPGTGDRIERRDLLRKVVVEHHAVLSGSRWACSM